MGTGAQNLRSLLVGLAHGAGGRCGSEALQPMDESETESLLIDKVVRHRQNKSCSGTNSAARPRLGIVTGPLPRENKHRGQRASHRVSSSIFLP